MRNKFLMVVCALSITFTLVACGNNENVEDTSTPSITPTETSTPIPTPEPTATSTPTPTPTATPEPTATSTPTPTPTATPTPHEHSYTSTVTKEPTCEADGQGEITYTCSNCGDTYTEETDRIDHCTDDIKIIQEATCSQVGIKTYSCIFCGREFEREELSKLPHKESAWIITVEPTSTSKGSKQKVCTVCGAEIAVEEIEKTAESSTKNEVSVVREYYRWVERSSITKYGSVITTSDRVCYTEMSDGTVQETIVGTIIDVDESGYSATDEELLPETLEVTSANMSLYQEALKLANEFRVASGVEEAILDEELCQRATMRVLEMFYADYWNEYRRADGRFCREFDCFPYIKNGEAMHTAGEDASEAMTYFTRACPDNVLQGSRLGFGYYGILWVIINYG